MKKAHGLTLIELMVTLAVLAIVISYGAPRLGVMLDNNRLTAQINGLVSNLSYARTEAVKRGAIVMVSSLSGDGSWEDGWVVWVDDNANGAMDAGESLGQTDSLGGTSTLAADGADVQFLPDGTLGNTSPFEFLLCDGRPAGDYGKRVSIGATGRPTLSTGESCT